MECRPAAHRRGQRWQRENVKRAITDRCGCWQQRVPSLHGVVTFWQRHYRAEWIKLSLNMCSRGELHSMTARSTQIHTAVYAQTRGPAVCSHSPSVKKFRGAYSSSRETHLRATGRHNLPQDKRLPSAWSRYHSDLSKQLIIVFDIHLWYT